MKFISRSLSIVILLFVFSNIQAQDSGFGAGVMFGSPSGFSGKYWLNNNNAVDFGLGYSFIDGHEKISLHADFLYHLEDVIDSPKRMPLYYGFGARLKAQEDSGGSLGARGVIGITWLVDKEPLDVFLEFAPVFKLFPATELDLDASIGVRYFFK